jgi:hypothetical protein
LWAPWGRHEACPSRTENKATKETVSLFSPFAMVSEQGDSVEIEEKSDVHRNLTPGGPGKVGSRR